MRTTALAVATIVSIATMNAYALGTDRAAGTKVVQPKNPVDAKVCLACHNTAIKTLTLRGAHKDVNCASCHDIKPEHMKAPSAKNRPTTHFEYAACGQCHPAQPKDLMDPKYHYEWALKYAPPAYSGMRDIYGDNQYRSNQYRLPRFHANIVTDLITIRSDGRFAYKDYKDLSKPVGPRTEATVDTRPEEGDRIGTKDDVMSLTWRPHKGREVMGRSDCLKCKTVDHLMEYAYLGKDKPGVGLVFDDPDAKVVKAVNNSFNCVTCHDPHSAEPRITFDHVIESMTHPDFKDFRYQKNAGSLAYLKVEVLSMGVRGYERKIAILERYNSNYMCGQCHMGHNRSSSWYDAKTNKLLHKANIRDGEGWWVGTTFASNPLEWWNIVYKKGMHNGIDAATGVKTVGTDHYHMETLTGSKHGQAGVGCVDCHFAKKADGTLEHQPSLPRMKYKNTCARSECHGNPKGDNWSEGQAAYMVQVIQQRYRIHQDRLERYGKQARDLLIKAKNGDVKIPKTEYDALKIAYSQYLTVRGWYSSDYSNGVHDPSGFEKTSSIVIKRLRSATDAAQKVSSKAEAKSVAQK